MRRIGARIGLAGATAALALSLGAGSAAATTFCVPSFHAACPNSGGNVAEADLEKAMGLNGADGKSDAIVIAAGIFAEDGKFEPASGSASSFEPTGSDPMTITGAGRGQTILTSTGSGNNYLLNLNSNNSRAFVVRDLTLRVPATFTPGAGTQLDEDDVFERVDIEARSSGADGATVNAGGTFVDGRLYGAEGGSIDKGFRTNATGVGVMTIERTKIEKPSWGIVVNDGAVVSHLRRIEIVEPVAYGLRVEKGGIATLSNGLITTKDGYGVKIESGAASTTTIVTLRHLTLVDTGGVDNPAIEVGDGFTNVSASINAVVRDSIVAGYDTPLKCTSPMTNTSLSVGYSYLLDAVTKSGNCNVSVFNSLDAAQPEFGPPQFLGPGNYRLPAGSPAIDAGDPATATLPTEDLLGAPRPVDGDGDGVARRDIGAYEYQPPKPADPSGGGNGGLGGGLASDITPPRTSIVKGPGKKLAAGVAAFHFRSSEAGSTFRCKLDGKPARGCRSPRTYRRLKPGRHVFRVWAVDAAGNVSPKPAKRRFRVPKP